MLKCWGNNANGQLGTGALTILSTPSWVIDSGTSYQLVKSGYLRSCGITNLGELKCWGDDFMGAVGMGKSHLLLYVPNLRK